MVPTQTNQTLDEYLTVGEAAEFLGVSPWTLRNWDKAGKLKTLRHPKNGYRIYRHEDLEAILQPEGLRGKLTNRLTPEFDCSAVGDAEHFVQFYESDAYLVASVSRFVGMALEAGEGGVVIATRTHRNAIHRKLRARGLDPSAASTLGQYVALDAAETLSKFMVDGMPDRQRFFEVVGEIVANVVQGRPRVRAFGEMVALLWAEGKRDAAIRLEELWNDLGKIHSFALLCAYPIKGFGEGLDEEPFSSVCTCHSRVIPAESYAKLPNEDERLRAITRLQQKAQSLEAEIAHRSRIEEALRHSERDLQLLAAIVESSQDAIISKTLEGQILSWNTGAERLFGYKAAEAIGRPITLLIPPDRLDEEHMILERLRRGERIEHYETVRVSKQGKRLDISVTISPLRDSAGRVVGASKVARDISDRKRSEEALREADRRKDEFLAVLAHELRNPLAPVRNALQIMRLAGDNRLAVEQARTMMERQVHLMVRLVDDLLDISRITRGKVELKKERVALSSIVASAVETSRPLIEAARHALHISLPSDTLELEADSTRLAQVLSNLLNNAAKYSDPGGQIWLTAEREGQQVAVRVRDTGVGIPAEMLPRVFDMFMQVDRFSEKTQGGLGVGLTLVRTLVELHKGSVEVHSDGPGLGSEFMVRLPLAPERRPALSGSNGQKDAGQAMPMRRVLVVDDNTDSAISLAMLLRIMGQDVRTAHDGRAALEAARDFQPELAFLDIGLPGMSGYELARRLREEPGSETAMLVALTGWGQEEDRRRSREAGFDEHLTKPADPTMLEQILCRPTMST